MMQEHTQVNKLVDHLFRHEAGKMVAVLTRVFGPEHMQLAEDVVQDALAEAVSHWQFNGIPDKPEAWLYRVAKNKALNMLNREQYQRQYMSAAAQLLRGEWTSEPAMDHLFSESEIRDDQLRMIFTCCHPAISSDSQVALALKTLCGFSIPEIARAFLTTEENVNKRLVRARQKIREDKIPFEVPVGRALGERLSTVLETVYLLFNEGYSASGGDELIRYELCEEAIRLAGMIAAHPAMEQKEVVFALLALMELNASRFKARRDNEGNLLTMAEQDRTLWDRQLIGYGMAHLERADPKDRVSAYYILAAISASHCLAKDFESTNWQQILMLYDNLMEVDRSPLVLLNRAVAVSKVHGAISALQELDRIKDAGSLGSYYLLYSAQAEFYMQAGQPENAVASLNKAIELTQMQAEKKLLEKRLNECLKKIY